MRAGAGRLWGKVKNVESSLSARKLQEEADIPQECFELLESCVKDEWMRQVRKLWTRGCLEWMEIKTCSEFNGTDPKSRYCVSRIVNNFQEQTVHVKSCDEPWTTMISWCSQW